MESGLFKRHGLTIPQYNVLRILKGQLPNAATVNLLIDRMIDKSSNASRIVEKLRAKGLIDRHECKDDRRRVDVIINEKGLALLELATADMKKFHTDHRALTPEEALLLSDLLDKLRCDKELK